jgi:hypothetical protein
VAPVDGTYLFGATLLYKINASATARIRGRLVLNGTTEIRGSLGEISATHVSLATAIWLQTMVAQDSASSRGRIRYPLPSNGPGILLARAIWWQG